MRSSWTRQSGAREGAVEISRRDWGAADPDRGRGRTDRGDWRAVLFAVDMGWEEKYAAGEPNRQFIFFRGTHGLGGGPGAETNPY